MRIILAALGVCVALVFTKRQNWKLYYPTVLFMITMNLAMSIITHNHRLWLFLPSSFLTTHTMSDLWHSFITFPATVLVFLSLYPQPKSHQICYVLAWSALYSSAELLFECLDLVTYKNGWSWAWSTLFNCLMFPILRIHFLNPLLAWGLSSLILAYILVHFGFSLEMLE